MKCPSANLLKAVLASALVATVFTSAGAAAKPPLTSATAIADLEPFLDGVMAQQIASREVAGAVITVVRDGRVLFSRGYGMSDVDRSVPVDGASTLFRPGSISKLFTWIALMQQVEAGKVDLDADVNRYIDFVIPAFEGKPIRVRDLLSHSPGMSDVGGFVAANANESTPYAEWIKAHIPARLWPAGTEIAYSNYGAALAGYIVERVSGEPFANYAEKHIFAPLGMTSTTFREPLSEGLISRMAAGYQLVDGRFVAQPPEFLGAVMPAGSATTSGPDMARFMLALMNGGALGKARVLTPKSMALLQSDSFGNSPDLPPMAHGFLVYRRASPRLIGHAGKTPGFSSDMIIAPETGTGFFVSVTGGKDSGKGRTELSNLLVGRLFPQAPAPRWTGRETGQPLGVYRANRRDFGKDVEPGADLILSSPRPRQLTVEIAGVKTAWDQIGPNLYEKVTGARAGGPYDQMQFYTTPLGARLSFASQPYMAYRLIETRQSVPELPEGNRL